MAERLRWTSLDVDLAVAVTRPITIRLSRSLNHNSGGGPGSVYTVRIGNGHRPMIALRKVRVDPWNIDFTFLP